jgi:hypothetical protein
MFCSTYVGLPFLFEDIERKQNGALAYGYCCVYFIIEVTGWISIKDDGRAYIESR